MIIIQANGAERELEEKILALLRREDIAAERVSLSSRHTLTFPELTIDGRSQQAFQNGTALALTRIDVYKRQGRAAVSGYAALRMLHTPCG